MEKKAISHRFHIVTPEQFGSDSELWLKPFVPPMSHEVFALGPASLEQEPVADEHGLRWNLKFAATSDDCSLIKWSGLRACVVFHMMDGSLRLLGNYHCLPLITVTPHSGVVRFSAELEDSDPILL